MMGRRRNLGRPTGDVDLQSESDLVGEHGDNCSTAGDRDLDARSDCLDVGAELPEGTAASGSRIQGPYVGVMEGNPVQREQSGTCVRQGLNYGQGDRRRAGQRRQKAIKVPPFDGKEDWKVWQSRFKVIARRLGWTDEEKLDNLLPSMQGSAAEFVVAQLPHQTLNDYDKLMGELTNRYRVVETPRIFAAYFSTRIQRQGETAEEYAAELKRLYDKAHGYRDARTRQEDLVRRFLDGLWDEEARFEVEYHKEPNTIDEAVYHVVNLIQTRSRRQRVADRARRPVRKTADVHGEKGGNYPRWEQRAQPELDKFSEIKENEAEKEVSLGGKDPKEVQSATNNELLKMIVQRLENLERSGKPSVTADRPRSNIQRNDIRPKEIICYNCQMKGHFARNCPGKVNRGQRLAGDRNRFKGEVSQGNGQQNRVPLN